MRNEGEVIVKTQEELYSEISEYVLTLKGRTGEVANISTRSKREKILKDIVPILISHGHEEPDEKDYEEYCTSRRISIDTFEDYRKKIELFFTWSRERRKRMMVDEAVKEAATVETEQVEVKAATVNVGRKRFDTEKGEKRERKLMLYLTPSVFADVKDWCKLKDLTAVQYITQLIVSDMEVKQAKLKNFRELRDAL